MLSLVSEASARPFISLPEGNGDSLHPPSLTVSELIYLRVSMAGIEMSLDIASFVARVDANRSIKDELMGRLKEIHPRKRISVTDLVNPRRAFMQRVHPDIQPPLERKEAMMAGKGFHDLFGHAVSSEEFLEQFVEWSGVVGVIDVYRDIPTELKTTSDIDEGGDLRESRASYVEQLAMYCAMVDQRKGRLILYGRGSADSEATLAVYDAIFDDLAAVKTEMGKRRDALVTALMTRSPDGLPRCPWLGRGCEFESMCGCAGAEEFVPSIAKNTSPLEPNPDEAKRLLSMLESSRPARRTGLNSLVFPRRAYYDSQRGEEESDAERLGSLDRIGHARALAEAIDFGRGVDSTRRPLSMGELQDRVTYFKGVPTLLRSTKFNDVVSRDNLTRMFPHYFMRLAFECALLGSARGRLILHYEKLKEESKLMVYDVTFKDLEGLQKEAENRLLTIREVNEGRRSPSELPPCPDWFRKYCRYQPSCGC